VVDGRTDERLLTLEREARDTRVALQALPLPLARLEQQMVTHGEKMDCLAADLRTHMAEERASLMPKVQLAVMGTISLGSLAVGIAALVSKGG
jgi:hypothetical protein